MGGGGGGGGGTFVTVFNSTIEVVTFRLRVWFCRWCSSV